MRAQLELTNFRAVRAAFREARSRLVLHCAGLSSSPVCQTNPALARRENVQVTALLAELAGDVPFVFFSSDLVFDGRQGHYDETAPVNPLGVYAETKVATERIVLANSQHTVVRTSLNGGASLTGNRSFNETMRRAWEAGQTVKLFVDEYRSPLPAVVTARAVWELVPRGRPGLYHVAGNEQLSRWQEGPDCGGPFGPYSQHERRHFYLAALERLRAADLVYPCACSRQDLLRALQAPHPDEDEPIYPGTCRPELRARSTVPDSGVAVLSGDPLGRRPGPAPRVNWRFRVPEGETIAFLDGYAGPQAFVAGKDFGDFVVWRHDDLPAYQLAVVVDDAAMKITEVVRGADLLKSTARQLLLFHALGWSPPAFYHCSLVTDAKGVRLAKRHDALSLRALREGGCRPESLREAW